jgi:hypothetical protein
MLFVRRLRRVTRWRAGLSMSGLCLCWDPNRRPAADQTRYVPGGQVQGGMRQQVSGNNDKAHVSTSYVERWGCVRALRVGTARRIHGSPGSLDSCDSAVTPFP